VSSLRALRSLHGMGSNQRHGVPGFLIFGARSFSPSKGF
jgi:hypothetical protein